MTTLAASPHSVPLTGDQHVYIRPVRDADPPMNGDTTGFEADWNLRCLQVDCVSGPGVGQASFDFVPTTGTLPSVEAVIGTYGTDDQVLVTVPPLTHEFLGADLPEGVTELILFHGVLDRPNWVIQRTADRENEAIGFTAVPVPVLDNMSPDHIVRGRWAAADPTGADTSLIVVETPDIPACFNFRGRPNRATAVTLSATINEASVEASPFSHDDDTTAAYWTVRAAMLSLVVMWLYGDDTLGTLDRNICVEAETLDALQGNGEGDRWEGLDDTLPQVNVHGLGVIDALHRVCEASGFEMHVMPHFGLKEAEEADRLYEISINRQGAGPEVEVGLSPRGEANAALGGEEALRRNHISQIKVLRDASRVRNQVRVVGRASIEATIELLPMWFDGNITDYEEDNETYLARHVPGGNDYAGYRHIGRLWGVHCLGTEPGYSGAGAYAKPAAGYDWVTGLGLNTGALATARTDAGVADPMTWTRRLRRLMPLSRASQLVIGKDEVVEVSEDGGATWTWAPTLKATFVRELCAIRLTDVQDLAKINLATLSDGTVPAFADSWWGLLSNGTDLRLRVTCRVEADHASIAEASRQSSSGSHYQRFALQRSRSEEVWSAPTCSLNTSGSWAYVEDHGLAAGDEAYPLVDQATRIRDASECQRVAGSLYTWLMNFWRWRLGQSVRRITGRNIDLGVSVGDSTRYPSVARMAIVLSGQGEQPGNAQGVRIELHDTAFKGGA